MIHVVQGDKQHAYSLADGIHTVEEALEKFGAEEDCRFTVNGQAVDANAELRNGDLILIVAARTASGGLKGAIIS